MSYRTTILPPGAVVTGALFRLPAAASPAERERARQHWVDDLKRRTDTQPIHEPSCGSVFRNPPGTAAGREIEAAGLKGFCHGGAAISEKHANFIVVKDKQIARAQDVYELIRATQAFVAEVRGQHLAPEVRLLGEFSDARVAELVARMRREARQNANASIPAARGGHS